MGLRDRRTPSSYDEILRRTVPDPDLGFRPSKDEERMSRHRYGEPTEHRPRRLSAMERVRLDRVMSALEADPTLDLSGVAIEVRGRCVILYGTVPGPATSVRIEEIAADIEGVDSVDNQLVTRSHRV